MTPRTTIQPFAERLRPALLTVLGFLAAMWGEEGLDGLAFGGRLDAYGILPRTETGLRGILFEPFLHDGFAHLISNTVPFALLAFIILLRGLARFWAVTLTVMALGGLAVWLFAPANTLHIGASGLVFGYLGYLVAAGFFERDTTGILIGLGVLAVYGGVLWGVLPVTPGVSWQSHLFGLIAGVLAARWFSRSARARRLPS